MKARGFTIIELMIAIAILAVLITVVAPSFIEVIENNRIQTQTENMFRSLSLARSEAIKRNQSAVICKSSSGTSCTTSGNWEQGWLIYADEDGDGTLDTGEDVLHTFGALPSGYTLRTNAYDNKATYRSDGTISQQGSFFVCDPDGETDKGRKITISSTGRPRTQKGLDGDDSCT